MTVSNDTGSDTRSYVLQVDAVKPKITIPSGVSKKYTVGLNQDFSIDISPLTFTGTKPLKIDVDSSAKSAGLRYDGTTNTIRGKITQSPANDKLTFNLEASNPFTQSSAGGNVPVKLAFTLTVKTPPDVVKLPEGFNQYGLVYDIPVNTMPVQIGKNFKVQLTTQNGSKPLVWDFIIEGMTDDLNGKSIIKDLGGKFEGVTFSEKGIISGKPTNSRGDFGRVLFRPVASNEVGSTRIVAVDYRKQIDERDLAELRFFVPPVFDKQKTSVPIKIVNGQQVSIYLFDYIEKDKSLSHILIWKIFDPPHPAQSCAFIECSTDSILPPGLKLEDHFIEGTVNIQNPSDFKKYEINIVVKDLKWNPIKTKIILDVQPAPENGSDETLQPLPDDNTSLPADEYHTDEANSPSSSDTSLLAPIVLTEREISSLSAGTLKAISDDGLVIAAVLPEISAPYNGMYDLDVVISDDIDEGAELIYLAFPQNSEPSDDDKIAEFYDDEGIEIQTVPKNHKIRVSIWLRKDISYAPVVAVKR